MLSFLAVLSIAVLVLVLLGSWELRPQGQALPHLPVVEKEKAHVEQQDLR